MTHNTLKPGENIRNLNGVFLAEKCDSKGDWYKVGKYVFSRDAALQMLVDCRGKRRATVEMAEEEA